LLLQIGTKEKKELSTYLAPKKIELHFFIIQQKDWKEYREHKVSWFNRTRSKRRDTDK